MNSKVTSYYSNSAESLGWGERSGKLDNERLELLGQFVLGEKVLDIGCGFGSYVDFLTRRGFKAWGLDFTRQFVSHAKKTKQGNFVVGEAEKLPFKNNFFETVILFDVLEHGHDLKILLEAKRVAKNRVLIIVPSQVDKNLEQAGVIYRHYIDKSHMREYTEIVLKSLARKAKLKITFFKRVHPLYNETIFFSLFEGNIFLKKIIRKIIFKLLPKKIYYTEFFMVLDI